MHETKQAGQTIRRRRGGFTLVELMVVVSIIGVIGSFAIPSLQDYARRSRRTEAFTVLGGIYKAQKVYHMEHDQYGGTYAELGFEIGGGNEINPTTIQSSVYTYTLEAFSVAGSPNANYSAVATGDLNPGDPMLDIIMIEGGVIIKD